MEFVYSHWLEHLYAHANISYFYFYFNKSKYNPIFHQKSLRQSMLKPFPCLPTFFFSNSCGQTVSWAFYM